MEQRVMADQPLSSKPPELRIHTATAGDATAWVAAGWELFKKAPGPWMGI
ncbi:MAG: hypothetical protein IT469_11700, partial [Pseudomonadales bacterium]|nr:hypothetical protein [Pseudomonadales bacterium]